MMKILIIKTSSLGDIVQTFSLLPYLTQQASQIDWVVEEAFAGLVEAHPLVHRVFPVKIKQWRSHFFQKKTWQEIGHFRQELRQCDYDKVLDLQGNIKSGCLTALSKSEEKIGFDYASAAEWPNIFATHQRYRPPLNQNIREDYFFLAQNAFQEFSPLIHDPILLNLKEEEKIVFKTISDQFSSVSSLKVMVCPGSQWPNKQLSKETLKTFLELLTEKLTLHFIFIWGNTQEKEWVEELTKSFPKKSSVLPKLSLPVLQNLMGQMDVVIAMDSLPLHLAATTATATYSIFGPSSARKYQPIGQRHYAVQGKCPYQQQFEKRCPRLRTCLTGACMKDLQPAKLAEEFLRWWKRRSDLSMRSHDFPKKFYGQTN